jgi:hypothetical protein
MTARRDPDRLIHSFVMEGPAELADPVYDAVRATIERKPQRVVIGPWRTPFMNKLIPIGLGVAAVVVALVVGTRFLAPAPSGPGSLPTTQPTVTPAPSVASPSPSASSAIPPLSETFTSQRHGISMAYPTGWVARPATQPWTTGLVDFMTPAGDVVYDPVHQADLWLSVASQPLGDSTPAQWAAETIAIDDGCKTTEPIVVDGATGLIGSVNCTRATVTTNGRGYFIWLYTSGDVPSIDVYDRTWFESVLATVKLHPADAVDAAPSASP